MATPAEDVGKKRRRKLSAEDIPEFLEEKIEPPLTETKVNKLIGPLKKSRPELYQSLREYSRQTGRKPTFVVSEALHHYLLERKYIQSEMNLSELYEAWCFLADLQEHAIRNFIRLGGLIFSEEYQGMLELSRTLQGPMPAPVRLPPKARDISDKLVDKIWKFADPLIDWCLENMMGNMAKAMGFKTPPTLKGEKIPVEIIEEE